jgi:anti-anti-sigma factor
MVVLAEADPTTLHIDLTYGDGEVVVCAFGSLDWNTAAEFDATMRELSSRYDGDQIVVDLRALEFIDLEGVDAVARAGYRTRSSGPMILRPPLARRHMVVVDDVAAAYTIELD